MDLASTHATRPAHGRWSQRLIDLATRWRDHEDSALRRRALESIWELLIAVLCARMRSFSRRYGQDLQLDIRDLAVDKALDLIRKLQRGKWHPEEMSPSQLYSFLSTVSRNALVDHIRSDRQRAEGLRQMLADGAAEEIAEEESPGDAVARMKFVEAIASCTEKLTPRARLIWFMRVFFELPSKLIARHDSLSMSTPAVDVSFSRTKKTIKRCLREKGFESEEVPAGTFAAIWSRMVDTQNDWGSDDKRPPT